MEQGNKQVSKEKITTIKLSKSTKDRIDKLRVYRRETYDEIMQNLLTILNICKANPEAARKRLLLIDRKKRRAPKPTQVQSLHKFPAPQRYLPQEQKIR